MSADLPATVAWLLYGLQLAEHELLLFAAFWFIIGALDELGVDLAWLWLRLTGRLHEPRLEKAVEQVELSGPAAVLVPAWHEAEVIGAMIAHTLRAWPQRQLTLYVGCYRNDPDTLAAAIAGAGGDPRVRLVVHGCDGPTTKADCLNRLYAALTEDEVRRGENFHAVVLHDAEDMVHPAALAVIDRALAHVDFVQLPVRPEPHPDSPWVSGHYADEFAESHAKGMVVRDAVGAAIPAAGVGCGFSRSILGGLAAMKRSTEPGEAGPFAAECLTEDYELGLLVTRSGARSRFLRLRDADGGLVATRAYFPATIKDAVRQKSRWIHGIALQGWERLGWGGRPIDVWMASRDRQGPLTAIVLAAGYALVMVEGILGIARMAGWHEPLVISPLLRTLLALSFASFAWRAAWRFGFTSREYGLIEGLRAVFRIPIANIIAIMAARRALAAYVRTLKGGIVFWEKTRHRDHPTAMPQAVSR